MGCLCHVFLTSRNLFSSEESFSLAPSNDMRWYRIYTTICPSHASSQLLKKLTLSWPELKSACDFIHYWSHFFECSCVVLDVLHSCGLQWDLKPHGILWKSGFFSCFKTLYYRRLSSWEVLHELYFHRNLRADVQALLNYENMLVCSYNLGNALVAVLCKIAHLGRMVNGRLLNNSRYW